MNPYLYRRLVRRAGYIPPGASNTIPNDGFGEYVSGANLAGLNGGENGTNIFNIKWASVYSDTTFGDTAASVAPDGLSNLEVWVKADQIAGLSNGDPLSTWQDQSGNGRDFTAAGAQRPTYNTNVQNGLPGVNFTSTSGVGMTGVYVRSSGDFSIMVVLRSNSGTNFNTRRAVQGSNNWLLGPHAGYLRAYNNNFVAGYHPDDLTHVMIVTQTATGTVTRLYVDGGGGGQMTTAQAWPGTVHLGATGGFNEPADARVFEVAVYSRILTPAEVFGLSLNMINKWGA